MNKREIARAKKLLEPYAERFETMSTDSKGLCLQAHFLGGWSIVFYSMDSVDNWLDEHQPEPTLQLTAEDASELYFAFRARGYSSTLVKVAEFLKAIDRYKKGLPGSRTLEEWYYQVEAK